ncbi:MAG: cation-translocating P-type ATPase [Oscillospiraceae bacterium]|nr:cation-translocating P-type ATPase [Oscillospiraceae bacterium]
MSQSILERDYTENTPAPKNHAPSTGLTSEQAAEILKKHGPNTLATERKAKPLRIFMGQFKDVMVMILIIASAISAFIGEYYDAVTIMIIVVINAVLGFVQEYRTEKTLLALRSMAAPMASVFRDGHLTSLPAAELVPGDVISLEAGDKAAADSVILNSKGLMADESILTGESVPAAKSAGNTKDTDNSLGKSNIIYSGSIITKGTAIARVIATGTSAQMGKISGMLTDIEEEETPLQKRLGELGKIVAVICLIVCAIVAGAGILKGEPVFDMLMTGITIAIAAIPEGLPATVTIALALAVSRMLKQNALVHKLHSVETLGCTSVICTDKTGTVTENKMTVRKAYDGSEEYELTGQGYRVSGRIISGSGETSNIKTSKVLCELLRCGVLCSNADISGGTEDERNIAGDPTEAALLIAAAKGGMNHSAERIAYRRIDELPFDSDVRRMTVIVKDPSGQGIISYTKGAADVILDRCSHILTESGIKELTYSKKKEIMDKCGEMSSEALRVLAFAYCPKAVRSTPDSGMVFLGLMGMSDPPREEAKKAVRLCRSARIRTVMITGDHKNTAAAVARQAGILTGEDGVITGEEMEKMTDKELENAARHTSVFARVSPADKLRIVRAYKRLGHIVTMTGDGVNDAPAVKEADIGVAMGITGTDVTREAADMVLLDDNFATLVSAVEQGRGIYANIRKFVRYLLSCNIGEVLTMFLGIVMGMPMVLLPAQILLVNLVTDGLPAIALGVEPCGEENMKMPPRKKDESFFSGGLMFRIVFRGVLIGLCTLACFTIMMRTGAALEAARTGALVTLVLSQLFHVFECKSEKGNIFTVPYFNNVKLIFAVLFSAAVLAAAIYLPFLQMVFTTVPLSSEQLLIAAGLAFAAPLLQCFGAK